MRRAGWSDIYIAQQRILALFNTILKWKTVKIGGAAARAREYTRTHTVAFHSRALTSTQRSN